MIAGVCDPLPFVRQQVSVAEIQTCLNPVLSPKAHTLHLPPNPWRYASEVHPQLSA